MIRVTALAVVALPVLAQEIRIQVLGLFRPPAVTIEAGWLQMSGERIALKQPLPCYARGNSVECKLGPRVLAAPEAIAGGTGVILEIGGKIRRAYPGQLTLQAWDNALEPVIQLHLETAVAMSVAAEMPAARAEAAQAQAVLARSYYRAGPRHNNASFCDTTHCQLLGGSLAASHPAVIAAKETRSLALSYKGQIVAGLYFRSCGGKTFSAADVGLPSGGYPYYSVRCSICRGSARTWQTRLPFSDGAILLGEPRSENTRLELVRKFGWDRIPSNSYRAIRQGDFILIEGQGEGHGVGLCQRGAQGLAAGGYDFRSILRHYFPKATLIQ
jgi:stage II sporulation protein D